MNSKAEFVEDEVQNTLPPVICHNPREKVEPDQVAATEIIIKHKDKEHPNGLLVPYPSPKPPVPYPVYPLTIIWCPDQLYFEIDQCEVIRNLWVCNSCSRMIYIHCCGLWNETARMGAGWRCQPRTRFCLAPGLTGKMLIRASPRNQSPVPSALAGLQLAASHMQDHIIGYFVVPVYIKFHNYKPSCSGECE